LKTRIAALRSTTAVRCEFYFSSFLSGKQACWNQVPNLWAAPPMQRWPREFIWKFDLRNLAFRNLPGWSLLRSTSQECHQRLDIHGGIVRISSLSGQALSERS
jgi:hypothetical protein